MELLDDTSSSGELPADKRVGRQPVSKLGDDSAAWEIRDSTQWLGDTQVRYRQEFRRARFDDRARGCRPYSPRSDHNGRRSRRTWSPLSKEAGVGQQQPVRTTPTTQLRGGTRNIDGRGLTAKLETHCAAAQFVTLPENARYRRCGSDTEGSQRALSIPGSVGSSGLGRGLARSFSQPPAKTMRPEPMRGHRCLRPPQRYCPRATLRATRAPRSMENSASAATSTASRARRTGWIPALASFAARHPASAAPSLADTPQVAVVLGHVSQ